MSLSCLHRLLAPRPRPRPARGRPPFKPGLEALEERWAPAVDIVTSAADSGPGTLRAVVNTAAANDTINFDASLQGQTITLSTGQITLNKSLTIDGTLRSINITTNNTSRVFYESDASLSDTISNLEFTFNSAPNTGAPDFGNGGAIYDLGALTLSSDVFTECAAAGSGGAVYCRGSKEIINDCTFRSNAAGTTGSGGAIDAEGQLQVSGGTFDNNHAPGGYGGAIDFGFVVIAGDNKVMSIANVTFTNNTAARGGAVAILGSAPSGQETVTITGSLFSNNQATTTDQTGKGGGLYSATDAALGGTIKLTVANDTFYKNTADHGGGIALNHTTEDATATNASALISLTITANTGNTDGGGVWVGATTNPSVVNNIIAGNTLGAGVAATNGPDVFGAVNSLGNNLIGKTDGSTGWAFLLVLAGVRDFTGTNANPLDPGLDPNGPTNNGGPTETIKLVQGSVAYHNGSRAVAGGVDQRGYKRPAPGMLQTIGAYDPDATHP